MGSYTPQLCFSVYAAAEGNYMFLLRKFEVITPQLCFSVYAAAEENFYVTAEED